jgi:hypothetical protein
MKFQFILASLFLSLAAQATVSPEAVKAALKTQNSCMNFVRVADSKVITGGGIYWPLGMEVRESMPSPLTMIDTDSSNSVTVIETADSSIDVATYKDRLYVLTYTGLEERSLDGQTLFKIHPTLRNEGSLGYREHATRMAIFENMAFISHGRRGLSVFNLDSKENVAEIALIPQQLPFESQATSVTVAGGKVLVLMDNFSMVPRDQKQAFRGIIVIDAKTLKVESELDGMDPGADSMNVVGDDLLVSYMGMPIWKVRLADLKGKKFPKVRNYISKFGIAGHPIGAAYVDEKYYHTCFNKHPETPEDEQVITRTVESLERAPLKL